ncbi:MAG: DUF4907 domain-containing protein [Chitinophagaceae bacterium]|jgi:hypothetical protein|nr:DUF4907 domain-containing protein [Chitinophagaceae bacterium]
MIRIKHYTALSFVGLGIAMCIALGSCHSGNKNDAHKGEVFVRYEIIPGKTGGFGYMLYANDTPFVKQDFIPAISGIHTFKTQEDAAKVAKLLIDKLHNQHVFTIDSLEMVKLGIEF